MWSRFGYYVVGPVTIVAILSKVHVNLKYGWCQDTFALVFCPGPVTREDSVAVSQREDLSMFVGVGILVATNFRRLGLHVQLESA